MSQPTVLIVPGLRDHVAQHWQTLLADELPSARSVPPMGREDLSCERRMQAIETAVANIGGPVLLVAHSGGCISVAHWAARSSLTGRIQGALLATPPDFDTPMPVAYPTQSALQKAGWFPVPRQPLPFPSLVAISDNDPLATRERALSLATDWGSAIHELGSVGHLNPSSGFGWWPLAIDLIEQLTASR